MYTSLYLLVTKRGAPHMPKLTTEVLRNEVDAWVREMHAKVDQLADMPEVVIENTNNVQHNDEVIKEMKQQMDNLQQEVRLLRLLYINQLKEKTLKH